MSDRSLKIGIVPNEDGFGTSAWVVGVAKELARKSSVEKIEVIVATDRRERFHKNKYLQDPKIILRRLQPVAQSGDFSRIEVAKRTGAVVMDETIEKCILEYPDSQTDYGQSLAIGDMDIDLLVDFGVPQLVRFLYRENLRRTWSSTPRIATVTVFDHAWSLSLQRILSSDMTRPLLSAEVRDILEMIRADEALTDEAVLFGEPICPVDFHAHWRVTLGRHPKVIPGALGGPLRTLAYANDNKFGHMRSQMIAGTRVCPNESYRIARKYAREILGIGKDDPKFTLFISGGGTPVWDEILGAWVDAYKKDPPKYNVVIFSPAEVRKRYNQSLPGKELTVNGRKLVVERDQPFKNVTFIGSVDEETHHPLFGAFDLVLTRAGGGTVNDAVAFKVPLKLVEEPGMWQVEQIRQCCLDMRLGNAISLEQFRKHGRRCIESETGELKIPPHDGLSEIPNHGEYWLCEYLLGICGHTDGCEQGAPADADEPRR